MRTLAVVLTVTFAAAAVGVGCSPGGPSPGTAALRSKAATLETDLRAAESARDTALQSLRTLETKFRDLDARLKVVTTDHATAGKARDALATTLKARDADNGKLSGQLATFRHDLRDLLARADAAAEQVPASGGR